MYACRYEGKGSWLDTSEWVCTVKEWPELGARTGCWALCYRPRPGEWTTQIIDNELSQHDCNDDNDDNDNARSDHHCPLQDYQQCFNFIISLQSTTQTDNSKRWTTTSALHTFSFTISMYCIHIFYILIVCVNLMQKYTRMVILIHRMTSQDDRWSFSLQIEMFSIVTFKFPDWIVLICSRTYRWWSSCKVMRVVSYRLPWSPLPLASLSSFFAILPGWHLCLRP